MVTELFYNKLEDAKRQKLKYNLIGIELPFEYKSLIYLSTIIDRIDENKEDDSETEWLRDKYVRYGYITPRELCVQ